MKQAWKKILFSFMAVCGIAFCVPAVAYAASDTQDKIEQTEEDMAELEAIIAAHEAELEALKGEQTELQRKMSTLNAELTTISQELADLESQIRQKEADIQVIQENLELAREYEAWQYECMERRIQYTYERRTENYLKNLLLSSGFADILNLSTYVENVLSYDDKMLQSIIDNREYIEAEEERLEQEKTELSILRINAEADKSRVADLIADVSSTMSQYADQIDAAEEAAIAYEAALKKLEDNLEYLKKKLKQEQELAANGEWRDISEITWAEGDRYLLANLIYCEAGGEPYEGQLAVGSVVVNRMLHSKFPDTLVGVIYQKRQFAPVASGRLELALAVNKATVSCYQAADEAMTGKTNVGTCLFFRTPIPGLTGIQIGGHIFY